MIQNPSKTKKEHFWNLTRAQNLHMIGKQKIKSGERWKSIRLKNQRKKAFKNGKNKRKIQEKERRMVDLTTWGSMESIRRRETSRSVVGGTPSSSSGSRVFLSATILPVALSLALYTFPYVPSPTFSSFSYRSIALWLFSIDALFSISLSLSLNLDRRRRRRWSKEEIFGEMKQRWGFYWEKAVGVET